MIESHFYGQAAYLIVALVLLALLVFYLWRNISLSRKINKTSSLSFPFLRLLPLCVFIVLTLIFLAALFKQDNTVTSDIMIGQPTPISKLPLLDIPGELTADFFKNRVTLVNFWGSWCPPCRLEHPQLMQLAQDKRFTLIGINYKDRQENARQFLRQLGNPYHFVAVDERGRTAIEWGVYGAPETYLVSQEGIIIYRHIGPLTPDIIATKLLPVLEVALSNPSQKN